MLVGLLWIELEATGVRRGTECFTGLWIMSNDGPPNRPGIELIKSIIHFFR